MKTLPDMADEFPDLIQAGKLKLISFGGKSSIAGEVHTVACADDNSIVKSVLSRDGGNKILVIDASGVSHASMIGDQIAASAVKHNWVGIIVNGYVRDVEELKNLPIGIFAKGTVPIKTKKSNHGFEDVMVSFGSTVIYPGKWIYIDSNGWLVADRKLDF
jgi:regulator of ribonuclease activity A